MKKVKTIILNKLYLKNALDILYLYIIYNLHSYIEYHTHCRIIKYLKLCIRHFMSLDNLYLILLVAFKNCGQYNFKALVIPTEIVFLI